MPPEKADPLKTEPEPECFGDYYKEGVPTKYDCEECPIKAECQEFANCWR